MFRTSVIDRKTGKRVVFSECSYNHAAFGLTRELRASGLIVTSAKETGGGVIEIKTSRQGVPAASFYYDEERGLLLSD